MSEFFETVHKLADRLADENRTLREQVKELARQRDDARELVVRSGYFQNDTDALSGVTTRTDR